MSTGDHRTKDRMIGAGLRLFSEGRAPVLRSLTAGTVAGEAGFHRQTFYRHWDTQADFVRELVDRLFALPPLPETAGDHPEPVHPSFEASVLHQAGRDFDTIGRDPSVTVRIGLLAMGQVTDDAGRAVAQEFYADAHHASVDAHAEILRSWHRRVRPPCTVEDLAVRVHALLIGTLVQVLVDGDTATARQAYLGAAVALVDAMTEDGS